MDRSENNSSILLSIFRRKGGEGAKTKIVDDKSKSIFLPQLESLSNGEQPLICFKKDEINWLLITNQSVIQEIEGRKLSLPHAELIAVDLALQDEFKDGIKNKEDFTRLILKDRIGEKYVINLEKGQSYQGIYQVLHYIVSSKRHS